VECEKFQRIIFVTLHLCVVLMSSFSDTNLLLPKLISTAGVRWHRILSSSLWNEVIIIWNYRNESFVTNINLHYCLLAYDSVWFSRYVPPYQKNVLTESLGRCKHSVI